jgi:hypothetical protein
MPTDQNNSFAIAGMAVFNTLEKKGMSNEKNVRRFLAVRGVF